MTSLEARAEPVPQYGIAWSRYVTASVAGQLLAIPISRVQNVFVLGQLTSVPLAPPDVIGLMNLRGRIVVAIDLRPRLGLPATPLGRGAVAIGIEAGPDCFGLVVDRVDEIVELGPHTLQDAPALFDPSWGELSRAVHWLQGRLVIEVDVDAVLGLTPSETLADPIRSGGRLS